MSDPSLEGRAPGPRASDAPDLVALPWAIADGAACMATDEAMMGPAREGPALLRFYGWEPWCLSLGRNQPAPPMLLGADRGELRIGVDVVRRPTGGRSVFHGPEVTYAFACPDRAWGGPRAVYRRVHRALAAGLERLGIRLDAAERGTRAEAASRLAPTSRACFADPAPHELTVGGRKLVGSAQWRHRGALLQHGSILLSNRQAMSDLEDPRPDAPDAPGVGLDELLGSVPATTELTDALRTGFGEVFGGLGPPQAGPGSIADGLEAAASRLEPRYRSPGWLWRRRG